MVFRSLFGGLRKPKTPAPQTRATREIQIIKDGKAVTKTVDAQVYDTAMKLLQNPENSLMVNRFLESL